MSSNLNLNRATNFVIVTEKRIFWCRTMSLVTPGRSFVEASDLDGANRVVLYESPSAIFFGVAAFSGRLYITDWNSQYVKELVLMSANYIVVTFHGTISLTFESHFRWPETLIFLYVFFSTLSHTLDSRKTAFGTVI